MYLLVCSVEKEVLKSELSYALNENEAVENAIWLNGENAKEIESSDMSLAIGSMTSLFTNKEKNVLLAKIRGKESVEKVINYIKSYSGKLNPVDYFVIALVA